MVTVTAWKVSKYGVFSGPYLDTFHAVCYYEKILGLWILTRNKEMYTTRFIPQIHILNIYIAQCFRFLIKIWFLSSRASFEWRTEKDTQVLIRINLLTIFSTTRNYVCWSILIKRTFERHQLLSQIFNSLAECHEIFAYLYHYTVTAKGWIERKICL